LTFTWEQGVFDRLWEHKITLATGESCTGGLIAHRLTNVPGISEFFLGGVVAYSNKAKSDLLSVNTETVAVEGAVSESVARQMAEGVRTRLRADLGVGVTGIAGPGGGTEAKPVGLVYVAVAGANGTRVTRNLFSGTREEIKNQTADTAMRMLLEYLR